MKMTTIGPVIGFALAFTMVMPRARAQTNNTATGTDALSSNTTGSYNTATGTKAQYYNTTGSYNTATGRRALYSNASGQLNTATGYHALYSNTANYNTATGGQAMLNNTTGHSDTATGYGALYTNSSGSHNTADGAGALYRNTTGSDNTAVGFNALVDNTNGWRNTAMGSGSMQRNVLASDNTAFGFSTLWHNVNGQSNTAVGSYALDADTAGSNTAVGSSSLRYNTTGSGNTAVGALSLGGNQTGSFNTAVGFGAGTFTPYLSNTGAFGYGATATASNTMVFGDSSITSIGGYVAWSNLSDARVKTNVKENVPGLAFITRLRPVTFSWDVDKLQAFEDQKGLHNLSDAERKAKAAKVHTGFLAQEVEAAAQKSGFDFSGVVKPANAESRYELQYSQFVVPLVKAVQEQQKQLDEQEKELKELRGIVGRLSSSGTGQMKASMFGDASSLSSIAFAVLLGAVLVRGARGRRRADER